MALIANDFYIGSVYAPLYHFSNRSLELGSAKGIFTVDAIGNELSIDTFNFTIRYRFDQDMLYAPKGKRGYLDTNNKLYRLQRTGVAQYVDFKPKNSDQLIDSNNKVFQVFAGYAPGDYLNVPYGTPVYWYMGGSYFAKGYLQSVDRVGRYSWKLTCISGVGLLDAKMHVGGIYTGQTVNTIASDIIGNTFTFSIDNAVKNVRVYGRLPYDTARNNLHRLLFSCGASLLKKNASTLYKIEYLNSTETEVPASRIMIGGSNKYQLPTNTVEITEHAFYQTANDQTVTVFDNTSEPTADHLTVIFDQAPVYDLQVTSGALTINQSGVNYAVVSGMGVLTAKKYTHTQQIVKLSNRVSNDEERLKRVTDNELISSINSLNVARRVLGYFGSAKTVNAKILLENEKTGSMLSTVDAFGENTTAILKKMEITPTTLKGAQCELIDGYTPGNNGNTFTNRQFFSQNGTFTVPNNVKYIKVVLIGGGQGGQGGYNGRKGYGVSSEIQQVTSGSLRYYKYKNTQVAAIGGNGGSPGNPGKVYIKELNVSPGTALTITVGTGGSGGASNGGVGSNGTASTVTGTGIQTLSSANGLSGNGFFDVIAQTTFAEPGIVGINGGNGGMADNGSTEGHFGTNGQSGENVLEYDGGSGGNGSIYSESTSYRASGGGGGGAAYGGNGSNGTGASATSSKVIGGNGGNGASASAPSQADYGNGGTGGNGGGGGGNAGLTQWYYDITIPDPSHTNGTPGNGGSGSAGGVGGDGCVIIYY